MSKTDDLVEQTSAKADSQAFDSALDGEDFPIQGARAESPMKAGVGSGAAANACHSDPFFQPGSGQALAGIHRGDRVTTATKLGRVSAVAANPPYPGFA